MAASRYPSSRFRGGERQPSLVECVLAVSVIVGLTFVTLRIMGGGMPTDTTVPPETATSKAPEADESGKAGIAMVDTVKSANGTLVVKIEPPSSDPAGSSTGTP